MEGGVLVPVAMPLQTDWVKSVLFDRGYLAVDEEFRLRVSPRLRSEFGNGDEFYSREGETIRLPSAPRDQPSPEFLSWHLEHIFR